MEIDVIRQDFAYLIKQEKAIWRHYLKRNASVPIVFALAGCFLFLDAYDAYTKTGSFITASFSLSFGLLLAAVSIIIYNLLLRQNSLRRTQKYIDSLKKYNERISLKITDWGIISKSFDGRSELSWSFFETYQILGDFLFLMPKFHRYEKVSISKNEVSTENYNELVRFLQNKYPQTMAIHS
jgi:hypothetical protein